MDRAGRVTLGAMLLAIAGCDDAPAAAPAPSATASTVVAPAGISVGAEVVAAGGKLSFRGGKIVRVANDQVTFEYGRPDRSTGIKPTQTVPKSQVWSRSESPAPSAGAAAICNTSELVWLACEVKSASGADFGVEDSYGRSQQLARSAIVVPDAESQKTIADYLVRERKHRDFDAAFLAAGRPARPAGWEPDKGAKVVIHFVGTSYYGGSVEEYLPDKKKARVAWDGGTWQARDVELDKIVPQPDKPATVAADGFVLVRPDQAGERWQHRRVVSVSGGDVETADRDGEKRTLPLADVIPIVTD